MGHCENWLKIKSKQLFLNLIDIHGSCQASSIKNIINQFSVGFDLVVYKVKTFCEVNKQLFYDCDKANKLSPIMTI